jgi:hypothetical protein
VAEHADDPVESDPIVELLDPNGVPEPVRPLIPYAQRWGIGDDGYRDQAVRSASPTDLAELLDVLASAAGDEVYDWLAGSAADEPITNEYTAFTAMTMAADLARLLRDRDAVQHRSTATDGATRDQERPNNAG